MIQDKGDLGLQRSLPKPTSEDLNLKWCLASGEQAGHVLRADSDWEVVSKFGFVALATGYLSHKKAHGEGV